jgi:hypothetical protein
MFVVRSIGSSDEGNGCKFFKFHADAKNYPKERAKGMSNVSSSMNGLVM